MFALQNFKTFNLCRYKIIPYQIFVFVAENLKFPSSSSSSLLSYVFCFLCFVIFILSVGFFFRLPFLMVEMLFLFAALTPRARVCVYVDQNELCFVCAKKGCYALGGWGERHIVHVQHCRVCHTKLIVNTLTPLVHSFVCNTNLYSFIPI